MTRQETINAILKLLEKPISASCGLCGCTQAT